MNNSQYNRLVHPVYHQPNNFDVSPHYQVTTPASNKCGANAPSTENELPQQTPQHLLPPLPQQQQQQQQQRRDLPPDVNSPPKHLPIRSLKDRYQTVSPLGNGSFGCVVLAKRREQYSYSPESYNTLMQPIPNETATDSPLVAIKTMNKRLPRLKDYTKVKEVKFIMAVPSHKNLVFIHEMFIDNLNFQLHIVMETMDQNLYQFMKARKGQRFSETSVKSILSQILNAIRHIHRNGYFHRDVKPENILISNNASRFTGNANNSSLYTVKLADYGLARSQTNKKPFTAYVSTRWYRSPEILFRQRSYSKPVDIWAFGCVAAEIAASRPLFPGNHELEQIWMILDTLGSPNPFSELPNTPLGGYWNDASFLASMLGFQLPNTQGTTIENVVGRTNTPLLCDVVQRCLTWDPDARIDVESLCEMPYFENTVVSNTTNATSSTIQNLENQNSSPDLISYPSSGSSSKGLSQKSEIFSGIKPLSSKFPLISKTDSPRKSYVKKSTISKNSVHNKVAPTIPFNENSCKINERFVSDNSNHFGSQAYQTLDRQIVQCIPPREIPPMELMSGIPPRHTPPRDPKQQDSHHTYYPESCQIQQKDQLPKSQAPTQMYHHAAPAAPLAPPPPQQQQQQQQGNIAFVNPNVYPSHSINVVPRNPTPLRTNMPTPIPHIASHQQNLFNNCIMPMDSSRQSVGWNNPVHHMHPYSNSDLQSNSNIPLSQMTFSPKNECFSVCDSATDSVMSKVTPSLRNVLQDCSSSIESGDFESEKQRPNFFHDGISNQGLKYPIDSFSRDLYQNSVMHNIDINTDIFNNHRQKFPSPNNWQQNVINPKV